MNFAHKCLLAGILLLTGISFAWAAGRLEPGFGASYSQFETTTIATADAAVLAVPAFLQCIMISQTDAAPTAGAIDMYDHASAASGTKVFSHTFTTAVFMPFQICPQRPLVNGLYIDFNMADIGVIVSYKK
jgi:hypothetical protein